MIQANEIRIGNYISDIWSPNGLFKVTELRKDKIFYGNCFKAKYDDIRPIPLTEEILLKAGFEKNDYTRFPTFKLNRIEITNVDFFDEDKDGKEFSFKQWRISGLYSTDLFYFKSYSPNIESVHQLQNLFFALTGGEIKIEV